VQGAIVITRTNDRDFWTFSSASDANGHYSSFFHASDETDADPVPLAVGVALGGTSYGGNLGTPVSFDRNRSSSLDIKLGSGTSYTLAKASAYDGAVYEGLVVGVNGPGGVIKPRAEHWPDAHGDFSLVLPGSVRGRTLTFWENSRQFFSRFPARAGGPVDLGSWPSALGSAVPVGLATAAVPRR